MPLSVKLFADDEDFPANRTCESDVVPSPILLRAEVLRVHFPGLQFAWPSTILISSGVKP